MLEDWANRFETILLEGCDGTGKTTIAMKLVHDHGFSRVHSHKSPKGTDLEAHYRGVLALPGRIVLDRSFISEIVYGPIFRGASRLSRVQIICLAHAVLARKGLIVHVVASSDTVMRRLKNRNEDHWSLHEIELIKQGYDSVFANIRKVLPVTSIKTD